jgi:hypothetical protein
MNAEESKLVFLGFLKEGEAAALLSLTFSIYEASFPFL